VIQLANLQRQTRMHRFCTELGLSLQIYKKVNTPEGISVLDPELDFGELSLVLWTLTV
jgi:hypothetical protein